MPYASNLSFLGIAKETTLGTPVAATAFIPVEKPTPKDMVTMLEDKGLRGAMVAQYGQVAGVQSSTLDFGGDVFADTIGWPLAGVLGDVTTTGASAPYSTAMSVLNSGTGQPKSYTLTDYYVAGTREYAGCKFSEVGFKFAGDTKLTYTAKATGFLSATSTKPTPSFTALPPVAAWTGAVTIGGTAVTVVLDGEVTIKRPVTVIHPVAGSQAPGNIWSGPVDVAGKLTVVMESDTYLTDYLNNTQLAVDVNFSTGSGATLTSLDLHMNQCGFTAAEIGRGKDYVELAISFNALANSTDVGTSAGYSPIKATLQNAVTTGTYA